MTPDRIDAGTRRRKKRAGSHRRSRRRSMLTRTVIAGGAALCIGAVYELSIPTAEALSILLPGRTVDGVSNSTRINILEGNIFHPQFGGNNISNNTTFGNVVIGQANNIVNELWSQEIRLGGATGNGNVTQINILSYNIFNPQISFARNVSNNTSVNNVSAGNGNNNSTSVATAGGILPWFGGPTGNGNTVQFSFFSGNIFNPQWSLLGNESNNTTITNVSFGNGNYSTATVGFGGWFGTFVMGQGNGNTTQFGFFVSNIWNPQFSFGGGNISRNTAVTNSSSNNGNNSSNQGGSGSGITVGTVGNGNTNQGASSSGNIFNDQVNIGPTSNSTSTQQQGSDPVLDALNELGYQPSGGSGQDDIEIDTDGPDSDLDALSANGTDSLAAVDSAGSGTTADLDAAPDLGGGITGSEGGEGGGVDGGVDGGGPGGGEGGNTND
ncbi:hypothetical protein [Mycolicibacterium sp. XJ1819]